VSSPLDENLIGAVDHDFGHFIVSKKRLQGTVAEHVGPDLGDEPGAFVRAQGHLFGRNNRAEFRAGIGMQLLFRQARVV